MQNPLSKNGEFQHDDGRESTVICPFSVQRLVLAGVSWHTQEAAGLSSQRATSKNAKGSPLLSLPSLPHPTGKQKRAKSREGTEAGIQPQTSAVVVCNQGTPISPLKLELY